MFMIQFAQWLKHQKVKNKFRNWFALSYVSLLKKKRGFLGDSFEYNFIIRQWFIS